MEWMVQSHLNVLKMAAQPYVQDFFQTLHAYQSFDKCGKSFTIVKGVFSCHKNYNDYESCTL